MFEYWNHNVLEPILKILNVVMSFLTFQATVVCLICVKVIFFSPSSRNQRTKINSDFSLYQKKNETIQCCGCIHKASQISKNALVLALLFWPRECCDDDVDDYVLFCKIWFCGTMTVRQGRQMRSMCKGLVLGTFLTSCMILVYCLSSSQVHFSLPE